jgi:hypothetical protein
MWRTCYCTLTEEGWIKLSPLSKGCRESSAGIPNRYGRDGPGIESQWGRDFPYPSWDPPNLLYKGYRLFPGVKRSRRRTDIAPHLMSRLNKEYSYTSTSLLSLHGVSQGELYFYPLLSSWQPVPEEECKRRIFQILSTKELWPIVSFVFAAYSLQSHHGKKLYIQPEKTDWWLSLPHYGMV